MNIFGYELVNKKKLQAMKKKIQSHTEGGRNDVLTSGITGVNYTSSGDTYIDKNNYPTYTKQVHVMNKMYNAEMDYGNEILGSIVDTRVSFIGGAGISVIAKSKKTEKFISDFLESNKLLQGSKLLDNIIVGELEGKDLLVMKVEKDKIVVENYSWYITPYHIETEKDNAKKIKRIAKEKGNEYDLVSLNYAVYVKLGGSPDRVNETPTKIGKILTDIVNFSRAKYDLRKNNHIFSKVMPFFKTETQSEAKSINSAINSGDFQIGKSYAGSADFSLVEPSGRASQSIITELVNAARIISVNTGIPIHWLSYPDLMSNRATAENLIEVINAATIQERLRWEEAFTELVRKAMVIATEKGLEGAVNDPDGFELKLPLISYAALKQIQETWIPLAETEYISKDTVRNIIPGINPLKEKQMLEKEKEERIENSPMNQMLNNNAINTEKEEGENEQNKQEDNNRNRPVNKRQ